MENTEFTGSITKNCIGIYRPTKTENVLLAGLVVGGDVEVDDGDVDGEDDEPVESRTRFSVVALNSQNGEVSDKGIEVHVTGYYQSIAFGEDGLGHRDDYDDADMYEEMMMMEGGEGDEEEGDDDDA